ncbi:MAG: DUF4234 domain-containing protein [Ruminococcaceae bacterium]|nr:DUF4234 domain-containing protein [Oscillospiraceae bacterium]
MIKKRKIGLYIFLSIITLGIYDIVFWYKWTEDLNKICDGDDKDSGNYLLVLLLDVFSLFIYVFVWNYQMVERMYQKAPDYNVQLKHGGMFVILWRVLPLVSSVYKIKYFNRLAEAYNATVAAEAPEAEVVAE